MSKGSDRRKALVSDKQVKDNWDRIFNKPKKDSKKDKEKL